MSDWLLAIWIVLPILALIFFGLIFYDLAGKAKRASGPALDLMGKVNELGELANQLPVLPMRHENLLDDPQELVSERLEIKRNRQAKREKQQRRLISRLDKGSEL